MLVFDIVFVRMITIDCKLGRGKEQLVVDGSLRLISSKSFEKMHILADSRQRISK